MRSDLDLVRMFFCATPGESSLESAPCHAACAEGENVMASRWLYRCWLPLLAILFLLTVSAGIWNFLQTQNQDLPALPLQFIGPPSGSHFPKPTSDGHTGSVDDHLVRAFGVGCTELRRPYRLWLPEPGIAFAVGGF